MDFDILKLTLTIILAILVGTAVIAFVWRTEKLIVATGDYTMARQIGFNRDEAEIVVDLLMLTDDHRVDGLDQELRRMFGMVTREEQLERCGETIEEIRKQWAIDFVQK